jgi:NAD dependent epimerase/dehydratase family enzyme
MGSSGFWGKNLTQSLLLHGHSVFAVSRGKAEPEIINLNLKTFVFDGFHAFKDVINLA